LNKPTKPRGRYEIKIEYTWQVYVEIIRLFLYEKPRLMLSISAFDYF
jgi:hypothetical protein